MKHSLQRPILWISTGLLLAQGLASPLVAQAASNFDRNAVTKETELYDSTDYSANGTDCNSTAGNVAITGDNVKDTFVFLTGKGLKDFQAAGIIGNLQQESTARLDTQATDGVAHGIAQWQGDRWTALQAFATKLNDPNKHWYDLDVQLGYLWEELNGSEAAALTAVKASTDYTSATIAFQNSFERCSDCRQSTRVQNAQDVLTLAQKQQWAGSSSSGTASITGGCTAGGSANGSKIVQIALAEVGTAESPMGSNAGPPCKYQGSSCGEAWCADFVSWVYKQAGVPFTKGADGGWRIAGAAGVMDWFKTNGIWINNPGKPVPVTDPSAPQPGDVVYYSSGEGHVNIVVSYDGKTVKTVGGNQGPGSVNTNPRDVFGEAVGWGRLK